MDELMSEYVARKAISIGPHVFGPGDPITPEALDVLPPGRLEQLVRQRWLIEVQR